LKRKKLLKELQKNKDIFKDEIETVADKTQKETERDSIGVD
jgi:hypothetical protein